MTCELLEYFTNFWTQKHPSAQGNKEIHHVQAEHYQEFQFNMYEHVVAMQMALN